jgi:RNA polymerase sigma-70 factor (ECF subfamily)
LDSAPPQTAEVTPVAAGSRLFEISGLALDAIYKDAEAELVGLTPEEFASALLAIGEKYNYGFPPGVNPTRSQIAAFLHSLQLCDLALAQACALGRDSAWNRFIARFREPLAQAASAITGNAERGRELADSLYSEMFGLTERDGERRSPLATYSGRGSLMGFLRATIAQRNIDRHRRTHRESALADDFPATASNPNPEPAVLLQLKQALKSTLDTLIPEERFLLSSWFLDQRTLLEIGRLLGVHEATVSRRIARLTAKIRTELLKNLEQSGMSRSAAEEALHTDPRDVEINLRGLLQASRPAAFQDQGHDERQP